MATFYPGKSPLDNYLKWRLENNYIVFYGPVTIADGGTEHMTLDYHLTGYSDKSGERGHLARYRRRIV